VGVVTRVVYFIIATVNGEDRRYGPPYSTREATKGWTKFVRKSLRDAASRVRVLSCRLKWVDGKLDAASVARLDKFNMDAPEAPL